MKGCIAILVLSLLAVAWGTGPKTVYTWEDCGGDSNLVKFSKLIVTTQGPTVYVTLDSKVAKEISGPVEAKFKVQKKFTKKNIYVDVPCVKNFGSCTFKDACLLSPWTICPEAFQKHNIPCRCPVQADNYTSDEMELNLRDILREMKIPFIPGIYKVTVHLYKNKKEILCLKGGISLKHTE